MLHRWERWHRRRRGADEGLQHADVEDVVDARIIGQLEAVGNRTDPLQDLERPSIFGAELLAATGHQGLVAME
jgi:hypothetical protein